MLIISGISIILIAMLYTEDFVFSKGPIDPDCIIVVTFFVLYGAGSGNRTRVISLEG